MEHEIAEKSDLIQPVLKFSGWKARNFFYKLSAVSIAIYIYVLNGIEI